MCARNQWAQHLQHERHRMAEAHSSSRVGENGLCMLRRGSKQNITPGGPFRARFFDVALIGSAKPAEGKSVCKWCAAHAREHRWAAACRAECSGMVATRAVYDSWLQLLMGA